MEDFFNTQDIQGEYDLVILGAGPAGLTAAIYGSRDGLRTLVLEKNFPGGQVGITEMVENYPGFPEPITGGELAERFYQHAAKFGVPIRSGICEKIEQDGSMHLVKVSGIAEPVRTRTVIIGTG